MSNIDELKKYEGCGNVEEYDNYIEIIDSVRDEYEEYTIWKDRIYLSVIVEGRHIVTQDGNYMDIALKMQRWIQENDYNGHIHYVRDLYE